MQVQSYVELQCRKSQCMIRSSTDEFEFVRLPGRHGLVGNVIELNAGGRQFEPYLTTGCVCTAPLWYGLGCCSLNSRGLIKLLRSPPFVVFW